MFKLYTKYGDNGETGLLYGGRVSKDDIRCNSYGTVDEIISSLGLARSFSTSEEVSKYLRVIQVELFTVGSELATDICMYETLYTQMGALWLILINVLYRMNGTA